MSKIDSKALLGVLNPRQLKEYKIAKEKNRKDDFLERKRWCAERDLDDEKTGIFCCKIGLIFASVFVAFMVILDVFSIQISGGPEYEFLEVVFIFLGLGTFFFLLMGLFGCTHATF